MASKMKDKFNVGWEQRCGKSLKHFFVGELPICGSRVMSLHSTNPAKHVKCCKRCVKSLETALKKVDD